MIARARSLALSSHPGPTLAVTTLTAVLGVGAGLAPGRVVLLALAILCGQLSIGFSNDWIDAERDRAVGRQDKPAARGDLPAATVRTAAWTTAALTVPLSYALGAAAGTAHLVLVASGWSYNAGLKRTRWSVLPFVLSFGLLPAVVTLSATPPAFAAPWALVVGGVFGVSIHFTNVLPDLDDDARTGVDGLPHRLGRVTSGAVAFVALGVAAVVALVGPGLGGGTDGAAEATASGVAQLVTTAACLSVSVWGIVLVLTRPPGRLLFRLVIASSLLLAAQLALSGTRLSP